MQKTVGVLLSDSDGTRRKSLADALQKEGYTIREADNVSALGETLKNETIQLLVYDMDAYETAGGGQLMEIRQQNPRLCVVAISSAPTVEMVVSYMKAGVSDFVKRPYETADLARIVVENVKSKNLAVASDVHINRSIGQKIRVLRKERGMTLKNLANRTGLSVSLISQIELAKTSASVSTLYKITCALNSKLSIFFEDV